MVGACKLGINETKLLRLALHLHFAGMDLAPLAGLPARTSLCEQHRPILQHQRRGARVRQRATSNLKPA